MQANDIQKNPEKWKKDNFNKVWSTETVQRMALETSKFINNEAASFITRIETMHERILKIKLLRDSISQLQNFAAYREVLLQQR